MRGGSWNNNRNNARCAYRNRNVPDNFNNNIGFRLVSHESHLLAGKACVFCVSPARPQDQNQRRLFLVLPFPTIFIWEMAGHEVEPNTATGLPPLVTLRLSQSER